MEIGKKAWTGDFGAMLERRMIRVLVPYSRWAIRKNSPKQEAEILAYANARVTKGALSGHLK